MLVRRFALFCALLVVGVCTTSGLHETSTAPLSAHYGYTLTLNISGLKSVDGNLLVNLFNQPNGFPENNHQAYVSRVVPVTGTQMVVEFEGLLFGTYAVGYIHDENGNRDMDKNWIGIPIEGYGCSNNARGSLGPPTWKDAKIQLNQNLRQSLVTRY